MSQDTLSQDVALRIALAARVLPEVSVGDLIEVLQDSVGETLNETTLGRVTVTHLKKGFGQLFDVGDDDFEGEDAQNQDIAAIKEAVKILWGQADDINDLPPIDPYQEGDVPNSIRVAVASNNGELLDGHFGSCSRFLIYQLSATDMKLIAIRSAAKAQQAEDKNAFRVSLIKDCHVLYIVSIGGPAAAKVIQANIYTMKKLEGGPAREVLAEFQQAILTSPPPWVKKIIGIADGQRVKNYTATSG